MNTRIIEWDSECESLGRAVAAIGVFDGVHTGHRALISDTVSLAHEHDALSVIVTFDRDPEQIVMPESNVPQLLTLEDKLAHIKHLNVDAILVIPFCMRLASMTPQHFLDDVLLETLTPLAVVVGRDFRFGSHANGTVQTLQRYGKEHHFAVVAHDLVERDGTPVTSTRIRKLIAQGEVTAACRLLGRPHRVPGRVVHGRGEGKSLLGVPTANITPWSYAALPADGVYAGRIRHGNASYHAAISVGLPPTFPEATDCLEAHLIGFDGDLYDQEIVLEFEQRLRDQQPFTSTDDLTLAIRSDIEHADKITSSPNSPCGSEDTDA